MKTAAMYAALHDARTCQLAKLKKLAQRSNYSRNHRLQLIQIRDVLDHGVRLLASEEPPIIFREEFLVLYDVRAVLNETLRRPHISGLALEEAVSTLAGLNEIGGAS